MILSVLILSIPERMTFLSRVFSDLERQAAGKEVEILAVLDNKKSTIGAKRNLLMEMASGKYISFVDDDDRVEINYVDELLNAISNNPDTDCVTFDVEVSLAGLGTKICKYDVKYEYSEDDQFYYRKPNHIMCYKREIALPHKFLDINFGEDDEWASRASLSIQHQTSIDSVLYYYDYVFKRPTDNAGLLHWENSVMQHSINKSLNDLP